MARKGKNTGASGITEILKEGLDGPRRSLTRMEAEGERLLHGIGEFAEKVVPVAGKKAIEELTLDARKFFDQVNESVEENTRKVVERLNLPTKKEWEDYQRKVRSLIEDSIVSRLEKLRVPSGKEFEALSKQIKAGIEDQVNRGLIRLNITPRKDFDNLTRDVQKLRKEVNAALKTLKPTRKGSGKQEKTS